MLYANKPLSQSNDLEFFRKKFKQISLNVLAHPGLIRHFEPSLICSPDVSSLPNQFLIDLTLKTAALSYEIKIEDVDLSKPDGEFFNLLPGEHYRFLKALTKILKPAYAVEIGTATGMSSKAILQGMDQGKLVTFDIFPWNQFNTHLNESLFKNNFVNTIH